MLTVDYDRLGLREGDILLDLGCGFGRHAYGALARGARVIACDLSLPELTDIRHTVAAMHLAGELPEHRTVGLAEGDATRLPFSDGTFSKIVASEVLEHIHDDADALAELVRVLQPGGTLAVTVPAQFAERICWALDDGYHAPKAVGGHVRIYSQDELERKMIAAGLAPIDSHKAHALHSPYWWLRCGIGEDRAICKAYHRFLCWDIEHNSALVRLTENALNPLIGKSLVVYARKLG